MVNPHVAFERNKNWLSKHGVKQETDLQYLVQVKNFSRPAQPAGGDTGQPDSVRFPFKCSLVLGIQMTCRPDGQPTNPFIEALDRFRVSFQYNANSIGLVTTDQSQGGAASTIAGRFGDTFPARELALEAQDTIAQLVQNITPDAIVGTIAYHCLIWKYAQ